MNTTLETSKTFEIRKTVPDRVKSTNGICTRVPWFDNKLNRKAALEAEHKKAEAITILCHPIRIR
jgi:hypothetical protein